MITQEKTIGLILPDSPQWPEFWNIYSDAMKNYFNRQTLKINKFFPEYRYENVLLKPGSTQFNCTIFAFKKLGLSEDDILKNIFAFDKYQCSSDFELGNVAKFYLGKIDLIGNNRKILIIDKTGLGDSIILITILQQIHNTFPHIKLGVQSKRLDIFKRLTFIEDLDEKDERVECYDYFLNTVAYFFCMKQGINFTTMLHYLLMSKTGLKWNIENIKLGIKIDDILNPVRSKIGYQGPYFLINCGVVIEEYSKNWGFNNYQKLVDILKNKITFVQYGKNDDGCINPLLNGSLSLVNNTSALELFSAFSECTGCIGGLSSNMHLSFAFEKPCIVIAGGLEHQSLNNFPFQKYLFNKSLNCSNALGEIWPFVGCLRYLGKENCLHWRGDHGACMDLITPEMVAEEILKINQ